MELVEIQSRLTPQWLAGFFDGEGCVCILKHGTSYSLRVNITQADARLLSYIAQVYDASYGPYAKKRTTRAGADSTVYEVGWYGKKCRKILELLLDYVVVKHERVAIGLEFLDTIGEARGPVIDSAKASHRESLRMKMRALNSAGRNKPKNDSQVVEQEEYTR